MKLELIAPLNPTGVGIHAQRLAFHKGLFEKLHGGSFKLTPLGLVKHSVSPRHEDFLRKLLMNSEDFNDPDVVVVLDLPERCILESQRQELRQYCEKVIFYTVFETSDDDNPLFREMTKYCNEVYVPSNWAKREFRRHVEPSFPVEVAHEGAEWDRLGTVEISQDEFRILNIGKVEKRKGHYSLLEALHKIDRRGLNVTLEAYWHNFWRSDRQFMEGYTETSSSYISPESGVEIVLNGRERYENDILEKSIKGIDVAFYPTFAEGWGIPIANACCSGVPTVSALHTGVREYYETYVRNLEGEARKLFTPLNYRRAEARDGMFFLEPGKYWNEISPEEIRRSLQGMIDYKKENGTLPGVTKACAYVRENFNWIQSAAGFFQRVRGSISPTRG